MRKLTAAAQAAGYTIVRKVHGYAYPKNGNHFQTTPRVHFYLQDAAGHTVDHSRRYADLLATAEELVKTDAP